MAVLEARTDPNYPDVIAIAGLDAVARARAVFTPRLYPNLGPGAPEYWTALSPHQAYAVRGTVYFMDGFGTVFQMGVDGKQRVVTRFPIQLGEQEASFAVSPDGCQLAGTILSPAVEGRWQLQTMRATFGGAAQVLHTWTSTDSPDSRSSAAFQNLVLAGWDAEGPVVVIGSSVRRLVIPPVTETPPPPLTYIANPDFFGGTVGHLAGDGTAETPAIHGDCHPVQVSPDGDVTCYRPGDDKSWNLSVVRATDGAEIASVTLPVVKSCTPGTQPCVHPGVLVAIGAGGLVAATWDIVDAQNVATTTGEWHGRGGASGLLPAFFNAQGWVDTRTVFGWGLYGSDDAALVHLGGAQTAVEDLHFRGSLIGMLTT